MPSSSEQQAVIEHGAGHAVVSAVAGSGKTYTLIERISHLLDRGSDPARILVLMFNKSARDDFARRLAQRLPDRAAPEVFTFHSFGLRLCSRLERSGVLEPARLLTDSSLCHQIARPILHALNAAKAEDSQVDLSPEFVTAFLDALDLLKGALYEPGTPCDAASGMRSLFLDAYPIFERTRIEAGVRLFADLITDPVRLALARADVAASLGNRYEHIIVDEFQDVNEAQVALVRLLAGSKAEVMVVGDEDQTIYTWRGARPNWMITDFERAFAPTTRYQLSQTFRYGHCLSLMANFCIGSNTKRTDKHCISGTDQVTDVAVRLFKPGEGGGPVVVDELRNWTKAGRQLEDAVVLVREYANAVDVEIALHQAEVPYRLVGAAPFTMRPETLLLRAYMALSLGGMHRFADSEQLHAATRAALTMPTLYLRTAQRESIIRAVAENPASAADIVSELLASISTGAAAYLTRLRSEIVLTMHWAARQSPSSPAADFLREIALRLKLPERLQANAGNQLRAHDQIRTIRNIIGLAAQRGASIQGLWQLLESVGYTDDSDADQGVLITSIHRSKGLEWPCVILPDLAEGRFPVLDEGAADLEDERRLFYVASTRARESLVLCAPFDSGLVAWSRAGKTGHPAGRQMSASRFLYESNLEVALSFGSEPDIARARIPTSLPKLTQAKLARYQAGVRQNATK